jgi:hypothetical protein
LHEFASSSQFGRNNNFGGTLNNTTNNSSSNGTNAHRLSVRFERYMQSNRCRSHSDSCISFAAAVVYATPKHADTVAALAAVCARQFAAQRCDDQSITLSITHTVICEIAEM